MKSHNIYNRDNLGFTLMEVIVVMGLLSVFAGMGLVFSFDSYRGYLFRSEYTTAVHIIAKARNRAINNFAEMPHGVHFTTTDYTLFQGDDFGTSDPDTRETFSINQSLTVTGIDDLVFEQLSGSLDTPATNCDDSPCELQISDGGSRVKVITINDVGGIIW